MSFYSYSSMHAACCTGPWRAGRENEIMSSLHNFKRPKKTLKSRTIKMKNGMLMLNGEQEHYKEKHSYGMSEFFLNNFTCVRVLF